MPSAVKMLTNRQLFIVHNIRAMFVKPFFQFIFGFAHICLAASYAHNYINYITAVTVHIMFYRNSTINVRNVYAVCDSYVTTTLAPDMSAFTNCITAVLGVMAVKRLNIIVVSTIRRTAGRCFISEPTADDKLSQVFMNFVCCNFAIFIKYTIRINYSSPLVVE